MKFRAPETDFTPTLWADWVELCLLCGESEEIARGDVEDYLHDFGPIGTPTSQGDVEHYSDDLDISPDTAVERCVDDVLRHIEVRQRADWYPVRVDDGLVRRCREWRDVPAHVALVLADLSRFYPTAALPPHSPFRLLFEEITAASLSTLFGPSIVEAQAADQPKNMMAAAQAESSIRREFRG